MPHDHAEDNERRFPLIQQQVDCRQRRPRLAVGKGVRQREQGMLPRHVPHHLYALQFDLPRLPHVRAQLLDLALQDPQVAVVVLQQTINRVPG